MPDPGAQSLKPYPRPLGTVNGLRAEEWRLSIHRAIARFEAVVSSGWPNEFEQLLPGLDDEGIQRLNHAVAPYVLPEQVEALYRWRNGGDRGCFGGWRMRSSDELVEWYRFSCDQLGSPRTWLPVFDDQIVNIVTLDLSDAPPSDPSVWYGHTHDKDVWRLFDSIEALLDVVCDAAEAGLLQAWEGKVGLRGSDPPESLDGSGWDALRLARSPHAFRWSGESPAGSMLELFPSSDWPREWLQPLGVTEASLVLRGATHTIAQLVSEAAHGPVTGTIRGRVVTGSGGGGWWSPVVADGTGEIVVTCDTSQVPMVVSVGEEGEFDVLLETSDAPEPVRNEDPAVAAIANRLRPSLPTAQALSARPVPTGS